MSILDWFAIIASISTVISMIIALIAFKRGGNSSIHNKIFYAMYQENPTTVQNTLTYTINNVHNYGGQTGTSNNGSDLLYLFLIFILGSALDKYMVYIMVAVSISGALVPCLLYCGRPIILPSNKLWKVILYCLSPAIIVSLYYLSNALLIRYSFDMFYSMEIAKIAGYTIHSLVVFVFAFASIMLFLLHISTIIIPHIRGALQKALVKAMKLWWIPIFFSLIGISTVILSEIDYYPEI